MRNRNNVFVGAPDIKSSGGAFLGPAKPDKSKYPTKPGTDFKESLSMHPAGFIGDGGITQTINRTTEKIKDWNGDTMIITQTEHGVMLKLTLMESSNANNLKAIYGEDNVTVAGNAVTVKVNADELPERSLAFKMKTGKDKSVDIFAPIAQAISVGDVTFVRSDVIKYEVEFECFPDEDGTKMIQIFNRPEGDSSDVTEDDGSDTV